MESSRLSSATPAGDFDTALKAFLFSCRARGLASETLAFYTNRLGSFKQYLDEEQPEVQPVGVTPDLIRQFISYCQDVLGHSVQTANHNIQVLHTFFRYLEDEEHIENSPMRKIKKIRQRRQVIQTFSDDELKRLLEKPDQNTFLGLRDYAIMVLLLDAGCRVSEAAGLHVHDIDWSSNTILVLGKGNKEREIPFGKMVRRALAKYIERRGEIDGEDHLFLNQFGEPITRHAIRNAITNYGLAAGIENVRCSPHTCRHTFAKNWILNGGDAFTLQRMLGHTTMEMVRRYVDMATGDITRQHQKYSPVDRLGGVKRTGRRKILR